jgi:hypothetical protein
MKFSALWPLFKAAAMWLWSRIHPRSPTVRALESLLKQGEKLKHGMSRDAYMKWQNYMRTAMEDGYKFAEGGALTPAAEAHLRQFDLYKWTGGQPDLKAALKHVREAIKRIRERLETR